MEAQTLFSIVVPTYNRKEVLIPLTLPHFLDQRFPPESYEILVVDDGSSDGSWDELKRFRNAHSSHRIRIFQQENSGPAAARNRGLCQASGQFVLLAGDDSYPKDLDFLSRRYELHQKLCDARVGVLGYTCWDERCVNDYMRWMDRCNLQFQYPDLQSGTYVDFRYGYTSNLSFHRALAVDAGERFDERFTAAAGEDVEFSYRLARRHRARLFYDATLVLHHHHRYFESEYARRNAHYARGKRQMELVNPECFHAVYLPHRVKSAMKFGIGKALNLISTQMALRIMMQLPSFPSRLLHYSLIEFHYQRECRRPQIK